MPQFVRFPGLLLLTVALLAGCTSTPPSAAPGATSLSPSALTPSATGQPAASDTSTPTPAPSGTKPSAAPKASRTPAQLATKTATPTESLTPVQSPTPVDSPTTHKPTPTSTPTKTATAPVPADPIVAGAYAFPVAGCSVSYSPYHHDYPAADIFAARGCHFVASTAGTIDEVGYTDIWHSSSNSGATRGGLYVSLVGDDGVRYYGSHLSRIADGISPGARVEAGDLLGLVGDSGDARGVGTHVHYGISWPTTAGIWWVRRGWISPYKYLTSWQSGVGRSPSSAIAAAHAAAGDIPRCQVDC